ncbi:hypothetical protein [Mesorhizobium sp. M0088]
MSLAISGKTSTGADFRSRRAALMLQNVAGVPLEPATEDALKPIAGEI